MTLYKDKIYLNKQYIRAHAGMRRLDDIIFPSVRHKCFWKVFTISHLDPHTNQCETEVQR